ncbi:NACHT and WD repeat domain-containing protein [Streptomyces sp. NPDC006733]|uniref:NACHT and WD repeat domain-containing protein n=1 Tax=Streptomyces sp. NPDC006733 TaxID=3155460 RepID=UPI0033D11208
MRGELGPGAVGAGRDIKGRVSTQVVGLPPDAVAGAGAVTAGRDINAPVTVSIGVGAFERVTDAIVDPAPLLNDLDLDHFTGRGWLIERIDGAISQRDRGYVLIVSEAGIGKTSLSAQLVRTRGWPHHFSAFVGGGNPETARKSLAAQLVHRWHLEDRLCPGGLLPDGAERPQWLVKVLQAAAAERDRVAPATPLVLLVDGLDEAEPPTRGYDTGIPLGLPRPQHLPHGVHIVATSRFGVNLSTLRTQTDVLEIHVDGPENRSDLLAYLRRRVGESDTGLYEALRAHEMPPDRFVDSLAERCAGVWIYARYVLDEIAQGTRSPDEVSRLPDGLAGYYEEQIGRWRETADWDGVGEPLLATLAAAQGPADPDVLADIAGVDPRPARRWLDRAFRPFLSREDDRYSIRHQSLRDLFETGSDDELDAGLRQELNEALHRAHGRFVDTQMMAHDDWSAVGDYGRLWLPRHASACGRLDELVGIPGFLLTVVPPALLRHRRDLTTATGRRALGAYELALHDWRQEPSAERRRWWLHVHARRNRSAELAEACAVGQPWRWRLRAAWWSGVPHRVVTTDYPHDACAVPMGGRTLLGTGRIDGSVSLWDPDSGDLLAVLTGRNDAADAHLPPWQSASRWVNTMGALPVADGRTLVAAGREDGSVPVWDPVAGEQVADLASPDAAVTSVCAIPDVDGRTVLATRDKQRVRLWDPDTWSRIGEWSCHDVLHSTMCAVPGVDGKTLLAVVQSGRIQLLDPATGQSAGPLGTDYVATMCAVSDADGRTLLATSGGRDGQIVLRDPVSGQPVGAPLSGQLDEVTAMCAVPGADGRALLAAGGRNGTIQVWDPAAGAPVTPPLTGHIGDVKSLCTIPSDDGGARLASVEHGGLSDHGAVRLWDLTDEVGLGTGLDGHSGWIRTLCSVPAVGGRTLVASGAHDASIRLWDPASGDLVHAWLDIPRADGRRDDSSRQSNWTMGVCAIEDIDPRTVLFSVHEDDHLRRWDPATGDQIGTATPNRRHSATVMCVVPDADGRPALATSSYRTLLQLWDPATGQPLGEPFESAGSTERPTVCSVPEVDGHTLIAVVSDKATVQLYDPRTRQQVGTDMKPASAFDFNWVEALCAVPGPDGRTLLATGGRDGLVWLWDPTTCEPVAEPLHAHNWVTGMCVLPAADGAQLVTIGRDGLLRLWNPTTLKPIGAPLSGHTDSWLSAVCTVPDVDGHTLLATGGRDRTLLLWEPVEPS